MVEKALIKNKIKTKTKELKAKTEAKETVKRRGQQQKNKKKPGTLASISHNINTIIKKEFKRIIKDGEYNTRITIRCVYGFDIDYNKNAYYNIINLLQRELYNVVKGNNKNLQFHNLCPEDMKLPMGTRSVLGLGLKFCIEQPRPYQDIDTALMKLKRNIDIWYHLNKDVNDNDSNDNNNNNDNVTDDHYNARLYVETNWKPDPCGKKCAKAFDNFETLVNEARRNLPTYRRYNLHKFARKAMKEL